MNKFYAILTLLFLGSVAFAQTRISGNVKDEKGEGMAGVNIIVKGKVIGTISDGNGNYALSISDPPPFTLQFSFVGYQTQDVAITNQSTVDIKMEETTILGQEVVVSASRVEEKIMESPVSIEK